MAIDKKLLEDIRSAAHAVVDDICALDHAFSRDADGRPRCIKPNELAVVLDLLSADYRNLRESLRLAKFPSMFFDPRDEFATLSSGNPGSLFWLVLLHAGVILDTLGLTSEVKDGPSNIEEIEDLANRVIARQQWIAEWWFTLPRLSQEQLRGYVDSQFKRLDRNPAGLAVWSGGEIEDTVDQA